MKKTIIIAATFFLTGCLGEIGQGIITKNCSKTEKINGNNVNTNIEIKSKEGNVETITITEKYDTDNLTEIINSKKSEQNLYSQLNGITLDINNNTFIYNIDINNTTDLIKTRFNIKEEQHKQIKYYEESGYTCK